MGDNAEIKKTELELKIARFRIFCAEARAALNIKPLKVVGNTLVFETHDRSISTPNEHLSTVYLNEFTTAASELPKTDSNQTEIYNNNALVKEIIAKINDIYKNPTSKNILATRTPEEDFVKIMARLETYTLSLQFIEKYILENERNDTSDYKESKQMFKDTKALVEMASTNLSKIGLNSKLEYDTKDAKVAANSVEDLDVVVARILLAYGTKAKKPSSSGDDYEFGFMRTRYAERRQAQLDVLYEISGQKNEDKMALLIAVYNSLKSESMTGEKARFFGKSSLETIIENELMKVGIDIKKYDNVSDATVDLSSDFNTPINNNDEKYNAERQKVLNHINAVTMKPTDAKRQEIIAKLEQYINKRNDANADTNRGRNFAIAGKLLEKLISEDYVTAKAALKTCGIESTITGFSVTSTRKQTAPYDIRSNDLKNIIRDINDLDKMENKVKAGETVRHSPNKR